MDKVATAWRNDAAVHVFDPETAMLLCRADYKQIWPLPDDRMPTCRGCLRAYNRLTQLHPLL